MKELDGKIGNIEANLIRQREHAEQKNAKYSNALDAKLKNFEEKIDKKLAERTLNKDNIPTLTEYKEVMKSTLDHRKRTEEEREKREGNLIIYQVEESDSVNAEDRKEYDTIFCNALCVEGFKIEKVPTKNIIRLGKKDENDERIRPMKVVLENKNDKEKIMKNVNKLAKAEPKLKNISISHDYTKDEREAIKSKVAEAKEISEKDLKYTYKVRGPPWNLRLKKFEKKWRGKAETMHQEKCKKQGNLQKQRNLKGNQEKMNNTET